VYSNLRGDVPAKLRLRYGDLCHLNPTIVCCSLTGYGPTGPRAAEAGYDYVIQGLAGWMSVTGEPDGPPTKSGFSLVDYSGGFVAALALLAGVHAARRDGKGTDCDVSLFETALSLSAYSAVWYLTAGTVPDRAGRSSHPSLVPFGNFPTADGWLVLACPKQKFWLRLTETLGRPDLAADERFRTIDARSENRSALIEEMDSVLATDTTAAWITRLSAGGVPCGPVNDLPTALADPHVGALGLIVETEHPRFGTVRQVRSPVRVGTETVEYHRAPRRNEDADDILTDLLAYEPDHIAAIAEMGAFG
jgi:crotonobetainyl-CoA:carnitine CoA-transferase CaiB-like acyl-CoA transferase